MIWPKAAWPRASGRHMSCVIDSNWAQAWFRKSGSRQGEEKGAGRGAVASGAGVFF